MSGRHDNSGALDADGLRIWSCVTCRRRKIRCDRRDPCNNCTRTGIECHFPVTGRLPRRRDPGAAGHGGSGGGGGGISKAGAQRQSELLSRLRRLEAVVTEMSAQVEDRGEDGSMPESPSVSRTGGAMPFGGTSVAEGQSSAMSLLTGSTTSSQLDEVDLDEDFGRLIIGKGQNLRVGHHFWTVFCDEIDNIFRAVEDAEDFDGEATGPSAKDAALPPNPTFFLGGQQLSGGSGASLDEMRPMPSQLWFIWETYVENVDPFVKILHVPTMDNVIRKIRGINAAGPETEALLFAIALASVTSMDEEDVLFNFNTTRSQLIARFNHGTEQALARTNYMLTRDMRVLQAFVIYLTVLPHIGPTQLAWPLAGLVLRIATAMGLHRDAGESGRVSEYDVEQRRRLWWHICLIDSRGRDVRVPQLSVQESMFDTKQPANIDDEDLRAPVTSVSRRTEGKATAMTIFLVRCRIWNLVRTVETSPDKSLKSCLEMVRAAKAEIEDKYLSELDQSVAFDAFTTAITAIWFAKIDLITRGQFAANASPTGKGVDNEEAEPSIDVEADFDDNFKIVESLSSLLTQDKWKRWRWQLQGLVPWHAIGVVLRRICGRPWDSLSERAYKAIKALLVATLDDAKGDPLWQPLTRLMASTERYREKELALILEERGPGSGSQPRGPSTTTSGGDGPSTAMSAGVTTSAVQQQKQQQQQQQQQQPPMDTSVGLAERQGGEPDASWQQVGQEPMDWQTWEDLVDGPALWL